MAYLSLYRKYRSQSFEEVSGQDHVTRTLQNAIRTDRVAHAYLFCGPRGTGKTSTARLLAKALNCERLTGGEPCNECSACVQIAQGSFMDMKEIDAASHRGIDEIRDLRDSVAYTAAQGRYKVYVIDEAHQITGDAFNALLKTLEEPPPHVVFIMATTESHKIPATIVSRCQKFDFRRASMEQLRDRVRYVAGQEGAPIQESALELIAREANGGWRDALSLLEQVLSFSDGEITAKDVYTVLGTVETETLYELAHAIFSQDGAALFGLLEKLIWDGKDPRQLLRDVTQHYRDLMLTAAGMAPPGDPDLTGRLVEQAKLYGPARLINAVEVLAHADREARWSEQPRLLLEAALVRLMHPREAASASVAATIAPPRDTAPARATQPPPRAQPASRPEPQPVRQPPRPSPSPFVDEPPAPVVAPSFDAVASGAASLGAPPLTVGDARTGERDDDDFMSAFGEPPPPEADVVGSVDAPLREPAVPVRPQPPSGARQATPQREPVKPPEPVAPTSAPGGASPDINALRNKWRNIGEELKRDKKAMIQACLTDTVPDRFEVDTLVIAFPSKTMAEMFQLRGKAFSDPLVAAIKRVAGIDCRVRGEVGGSTSGKKGGAAASPTAPPPAGGNGAAPQVSPAVEPAMQRPQTIVSGGSGGSELIHNVIEVFDGRVMDDRES